MSMNPKSGSSTNWGNLWASLNFAKMDRRLLMLFVIVVLIFLVMSVLKPDVFPTTTNFSSMTVQFPEIGILAIAIMITMITGGIDLSVTATANLTGTIAAFILVALVPESAGALQSIPGILAAVAAALAIGALCGLLNGFLVAVIGITPILATLGTLSLYTGFAIVLSKGTAIFGVPQFQAISETTLFDLIPMPLIVFIIVAIIFSVILNRTPYGFRLYLLGSNPTASRFSGVSERRMLMMTYTLSGMLGALAGLIFLSRNNSAKADYGSSYVLQAILIAVLGGINPAGGFGKISGLVLAILALQFLSTGLNMLLITYSGSNFFKEFAWGALLLLVMVFDSLPNILPRQSAARSPSNPKPEKE